MSSRVPFIRVPYYTGDLKRDPNLGNYPFRLRFRVPGLGFRVSSEL